MMRGWARGLLIAAVLAAISVPVAAWSATGEAPPISLPDLLVPLINTGLVGIILRWFMKQNNEGQEDVRRAVDRNTRATTAWILGGRSEEAQRQAREINREMEVEEEARKQQRGRGNG